MHFSSFQVTQELLAPVALARTLTKSLFKSFSILRVFYLPHLVVYKHFVIYKHEGVNSFHWGRVSNFCASGGQYGGRNEFAKFALSVAS